MKKTFSVLIVVIMCLSFSSCGGSTKSGNVAKSVDVSQFVTIPQYGLQDMRTWGQGEVSMPDKPINMNGFCAYFYKANGDVLNEYISMMENNGFTLVGEHHQRSFIGSYQSYGLVCDNASDIETIKQMYNNTDCHINIWKDGSKWRIDVCDGIIMCDMGLRRDGDTVSDLLLGESLGASLNRKANGSYQTGDKRLTATVGEADVIVDGQQMTVPAVWKRSGKHIDVTAEISDHIIAQITFEEGNVSRGEIYQLCSTEEVPVTFKLSNGDKNIGISQKGGANFHNVTMRTMYLGEDGDTVLYLYAQPMDTSLYPQSLELMCAVNTTPEEKEQGANNSSELDWSDKDDPYRPDHSKLQCLTCDGSGDCNECGGSTYVGFGDARAKCSKCHGSGDCRTCGGSGTRN